MAAFLKGINRRYLGINGYKFVSQPKFQQVWLLFCKQQKWLPLGCIFCGMYPEAVVYDGASICVAKEKCVGLINPKKCFKNAPYISNKNMPNSRFILEHTFCGDMLRYVCTKFGHYKRDSAVEELHDEGMKFCEDELRKYERYKMFGELMEWSSSLLQNKDNLYTKGMFFVPFFFFCFFCFWWTCKCNMCFATII